MKNKFVICPNCTFVKTDFTYFMLKREKRKTEAIEERKHPEEDRRKEKRRKESFFFFLEEEKDRHLLKYNRRKINR